MEKGNNKPKLRFPRFTDPWEQRKLRDIAIDIVAGGDIDRSKIRDLGKYPVIANALTNDGIVGYYEEDFRIKAPAVTVTGRGDVGHAKARNINFTPVVRLLSITSNHDINFLENAINNINVVVESTGVPQLTIPQLEKYKIYIPNNQDEEKSIGTFFTNLDNLITLHQRKLNHLQDKKKSLLQKMFPKNGEDFPELRFPGFTDTWEQRKLGEVFQEYSEKNHSELPALTIVQGKGTIRRDESDRNLSYDTSSLDNYKMVRKGDFIVHLRSFEGGLEIAKSDGIISPAYHTLHSEIADSEFYYPYFRSHEFINNKLVNCVYGIRDGRSVDVKEMMKIEIPYTSIKEQRRISSCFVELDHLITLHQRKLEHLQQQKKGLLQQMFI